MSLREKLVRVAIPDKLIQFNDGESEIANHGNQSHKTAALCRVDGLAFVEQFDFLSK